MSSFRWFLLRFMIRTLFVLGILKLAYLFNRIRQTSLKAMLVLDAVFIGLAVCNTLYWHNSTFTLTFDGVASVGALYSAVDLIVTLLAYQITKPKPKD